MTEYTVTITLPEKYQPHAGTVWPAIAECVRNDGYHWLADSIEEQVKPAIEEPQEFGSVVNAFICGDNPRQWVRTLVGINSGWTNNVGYTAPWARLCEPEVLRVGLGESNSDECHLEEAAYAHGYKVGSETMNTSVHHRLKRLLDEAITSERKNALEKAIQAVEELAT